MQLDAVTLRAAFPGMQVVRKCPWDLLKALAADDAAGQLPPGLLTHAALRLWPLLEGLPQFRDGAEALLLDEKQDILVGNVHILLYSNKGGFHTTM